MSCSIKSIPLPYMVVAYAADTAGVIPAGSWQPAAGVTGGRGWVEMAGRNGNLQVAPGVQFTNDPYDSPTGNVTAVGTAMSADGTSTPNGITSLSSGSFRFVRPVWVVILSSGNTLATACVGGVVELVYG